MKTRISLLTVLTFAFLACVGCASNQYKNSISKPEIQGVKNSDTKQSTSDQHDNLSGDNESLIRKPTISEQSISYEQPSKPQQETDTEIADRDEEKMVPPPIEINEPLVSQNEQNESEDNATRGEVSKNQQSSKPQQETATEIEDRDEEKMVPPPIEINEPLVSQNEQNESEDNATRGEVSKNQQSSKPQQETATEIEDRDEEKMVPPPIEINGPLVSQNEQNESEDNATKVEFSNNNSFTAREDGSTDDSAIKEEQNAEAVDKNTAPQPKDFKWRLRWKNEKKESGSN